MLFTRLMKSAEYDPKTDVRLPQAAKRFGFAKQYFSSKIAEAYRVPKFVDAKRGMFFKAEDLDRLETIMAKRMTEHGTHRRGKLPQRKKSHVKVSNSNGNSSNGNGAAHSNGNGKLTVGITPSALLELIKSGADVHLIVK